MSKCLRLRPDDIKPLTDAEGSAIASDLITVDGQKVGYMYRAEPVNAADTGWCFFSGRETEEFARDPANFGIYDLNTIANYDPDVIALLATPAPCAFERDDTGTFRPVHHDCACC